MCALKTTEQFNPIKELFCDSCEKLGHSSRDCNEEKTLAEYLNKTIGHTMEHLAAKYIACPMCKKTTLSVLGDNSPSWDLICTNGECNRKFEVKSKAMSCTDDNDLYFYGGAFKYYIARVAEGLHMIIITYEIDRKTKTLAIKEVFHVPNSMLKKSDVRTNPIYVEQRRGTSLSNIVVKNKIDLKKITPNLKITMSYKNAYNTFRDKYINDVYI